MDAELLKKKMRAGHFVENNGLVLRTINILRYKYVALKDVRYALSHIPECEFLDAVNYLTDSGYIQLRTVMSKHPVTSGLADHDWDDLEGKVTPQGVALLAYEKQDALVKV